MKLFKKAPDGGPDSPVSAYFMIESKMFGSIMLLKFNKGRREEFHTHAFNAIVWFLKGELLEEDIDGSTYTYTRSLIPKYTPRAKNHRVKAFKDSWCICLRGPWVKQWTEYDAKEKCTTTFTNGRKILSKVYND